MRKSVFTLFILLISAGLSFSQNIGIVAGGGTSTMFTVSDDAAFDDFINDATSPIYSYVAGFSFENPLVERQLYLQFGLYSMRKGYDATYDAGGSSTFYNIHMHYFHIPLELKYKYFFADDYSINIGAGGYFGGGYAGTKDYTGSESDPNYDSKVEFGKTDDMDMKDMDYGLIFRAEWGLSNFRIGYNYGLGMANQELSVPDDIKTTHRYHQFYAAYYFTNE